MVRGKNALKEIKSNPDSLKTFRPGQHFNGNSFQKKNAFATSAAAVGMIIKAELVK